MSDDGKFPWRMYVYTYRIFDKYNKEVASFAVLGDDNPSWRPRSYGYERWGTEAGRLIGHPAKRSLKRLRLSPGKPRGGKPGRIR